MLSDPVPTSRRECLSLVLPITDVSTWHFFNKGSPVNLVHTYKRTWRCVPLCICDGSGRSESFTGLCRSPAGKPQVQTHTQLLQSKSMNDKLPVQITGFYFSYNHVGLIVGLPVPVPHVRWHQMGKCWEMEGGGKSNLMKWHLRVRAAASCDVPPVLFQNWTGASP